MFSCLRALSVAPYAVIVPELGYPFTFMKRTENSKNLFLYARAYF